jgi:PAS domain S-box-containing protein
MKNEPKNTTNTKLIRHRAEALLKKKHGEKSVMLTEIESIKLLYELEVHQIELELQKDELQLAKDKAEADTEKYTNLYDYAPFGYFTLNNHGDICELNFNGAKMLNRTRSKLINSNFKVFITSKTRPIFIDLLDKVSATKTKQYCEVRLFIDKKASAFVHIEATLLDHEKNYLITVIDVSKRKHAEIELIKAKEKAVISEDYLNNIINHIGDPFFVKDEQSRMLLVNEAFCKLFDLEREHIIGKTLNEEVSPAEQKSFLKIDREVLNTGKEHIIEESLTVRGRQTKTISTRKTRYIDRNDKKHLIGIIRDLTKRKIAEEQLKETLSQIKLAVDIAKLGVWELNVDSGKLLWNDRHLEFHGITRKEFTNDLEAWSSQLHPDDKDYAEGRFKEVFEKKSFHDLNFRIIRPNGDIRYLNAAGIPIIIDGKIVKVIGVNRDITESKNSEKKLKESEARNRLFTQNVPDFLLQMDKTGKITYINKTFEDLTQKDVIGSSIYSWIPEEFLKQFKNKIKKVFSDGGSEIMEHLGNGLKGKPLWFESKIGPLEKSGIITQLIVVSRDITERKKAELILKRALIENIDLKQQIEAENIYLKEELKLEGSFNEIIGSSLSLKKVLKQVEQVANTDSTVLILGETGTGKELIARAIHNASDRKGKPIVKVNCSALPENLIESELFGHEKGAFTGALNRKIGRFELANGGTIFLDEIGDLPLGLQSRLLRVLQESEFERVGGEKTIKVDVRVITATNRNLDQQVLKNKFRQDLFYRLNVFPITCPPLRDRVDDIPSLVHHFIHKYNPKVSNKIKTVNQKTLERLMHYNWPGNIRELEHVIERALIVNQGGQLRLGRWFMDSSIDPIDFENLRTLEALERDYIIKVLETTNWKIRGKNGAAQILGMQPTTLESRMKKRGIKR